MALHCRLVIQARPLCACLLGLSLVAVPRSVSPVARPDASPECIVLLASEFCTATRRVRGQEAASLLWAVLIHLSMLMASRSLSLRRQHPGYAKLTRKSTPEWARGEKDKDRNFSWPVTRSAPLVTYSQVWPMGSAFLVKAGHGRTEHWPPCRVRMPPAG